jgi:hypothetical protein
MSSPYEQEYADGLYPSFTLVFTLHKETGNYSIYCPEWKCELAGGKHPGHAAYGLIMEIVGHNTEEMREVGHDEVRS